jgi:rare lipoprotein A
MPLNSVAKVTNLKNNKSVYVVITDRGPYVEGRVVDLSKKAAAHIGLLSKGIGRVKVEYMPKLTDALKKQIVGVNSRAKRSKLMVSKIEKYNFG